MSSLRPAGIRLLRTLGLYHWLHDWRRDRRFRRKSRGALTQWAAAGRPPPPPDAVKYAHIRQCARQCGTPILLETGTWLGDAIFTLRHDFREIHSIELAPALHSDAVAALGHLAHVHLHLGDSATELARVARTLSAPTLFWLDGHWCGDTTGRGEKDTPIFEELDFLFRRPPGSDVVLIDDARLFNGTNAYPTIDTLRRLVTAHRPHASFEVKDDIIRIAPV